MTTDFRISYVYEKGTGSAICVTYGSAEADGIEHPDRPGALAHHFRGGQRVLKINGTDYDVHDVNSDGMTVTVYHADDASPPTLDQTPKFLRWEEIDHIHIY